MVEELRFEELKNLRVERVERVEKVEVVAAMRIYNILPRAR